MPRAQLERLRNAVVHAVRRACPEALRADEEDIVQRVLLRVAATEPDAPASYVRRAAYHAVVDELRHRALRCMDTARPAAVDGATDPGLGPEGEADRQRVRASIRACIDGLDEQRRRAVVLKLAGFDRVEVARALGVAVKRADNLMYRGVQAVRRCLERKGIAP